MTGQPRAPLELDRHECLTLLRRHDVGRLGYVDDGWPMIIPVNYAMDGDAVVVRMGAGRKFFSLRGGARVSMQVDSLEPVHRAAWTVLALGWGAEVVDDQTLARLRRLPLRAWAAGNKDLWVRIDLETLSGRRLPKSWRYPDPVD